LTAALLPRTVGCVLTFASHLSTAISLFPRRVAPSVPNPAGLGRVKACSRGSF